MKICHHHKLSQFSVRKIINVSPTILIIHTILIDSKIHYEKTKKMLTKYLLLLLLLVLSLPLLQLS